MHNSSSVKMFKKEISPNYIYVFLSVDGDKHSKTAVKITFNDILPRIKNRYLIASHIYNSLEDSDYNWQYKKQHIIDNFKISLEHQCEYDKHFITEEELISYGQFIMSICIYQKFHLIKKLKKKKNKKRNK